MILKRDLYSKEGVFGVLSNLDGSLLLQTLEHAYITPTQDPPDFFKFLPKVPPGNYLCVRGIHKLEHAQLPFETFEVTGVPDHTKILFHRGFTMEDSHGCILLGLSRGQGDILQSKAAFDLFMENIKYIDSFDLEVS